MPPCLNLIDMGTETFSDFLALLEREGELARVSAKVDPKLEIAAICDRVCKTPAPHGHQELDQSAAASLGRKGAAVRKCRRVGHSRRHQHLRLLLAREPGVGNENAFGSGRARAGAGQAGDSDHADGENEEAARPDEAGQLSAEIGPQRNLPAGGAGRRQGGFESPADHSMLAAGRRSGQRAGLRSGRLRQRHRTRHRPIHHLRRSLHPQPRHRRPQHRHVPRPAIRPAKMRHALAHAPRRRPPFSHVSEARRENAAGDRARRRKRSALRRHRPAAAGHRGTSLRRVSQRRRDRAGPCRTIHWKCPPTPRSSSRDTSIRRKN